MKAEAIFFYMALTGLHLMPSALLVTDFSPKINWGFNRPYLTAIIQLLNAVRALAIVYAFRFGKASIVSPLSNAVAPVIAIIIWLLIYRVFSETMVLIGMIALIVSISLLAFEGSGEEQVAEKA